jgi:hypothetical protein
MTLTDMGLCPTCPWWAKEAQSKFRTGSRAAHDRGDCRRKEPSAEHGWPKTWDDEWCGCHPARNTEDNL